jgi:septal ring factor EnvC (AmiA/AmiB activator)
MDAPEKQPYPCVVMESPNHRHSRSGATKDEVSKHDIRERTYVYYPVTALDDLSHVEFCRAFKGFAVVEHQNLDNIVRDFPNKAKEVAEMKRRLGSYARPPELIRAEKEALEAENKALHEEIARLKALGDAAQAERDAEKAAKASAAEAEAAELAKSEKQSTRTGKQAQKGEGADVGS